MTMSPEDAAVSAATQTLNAGALIVVVFDPRGRISRANYYFNPADALDAVADASNDNESARVVPALGITEKDLFAPQFASPLGRPGSMVHIENERSTACGEDWDPGDRWVPVPHPHYRDVCPLCISDHHADPEVPVPLTPSEFYDVLSGALERASWQDRLMRRPVIHLRQRTVQIRDRRWRAAATADGSFGYTLRQVRQMRRELLAAMRDATANAARVIRVNADELGL